ncbi:CGH_3_HP_G0030790.mRNA.1.CDS.1 [Saccharomyces cerevisiae]|nr:CGH_3_HP_G0030790.mRNA.1.CDS.1 [Saccharomyces cerevisiae]CAI6465311.1 CGH_3_HP_G0030790.mRNA.1.CDS.1 [Saccharomyces cerevisiae]
MQLKMVWNQGIPPSDSENPQSTVTIGYNESVAGGYSRGNTTMSQMAMIAVAMRMMMKMTIMMRGEDEGDEFVRTPLQKVAHQMYK